MTSTRTTPTNREALNNIRLSAASGYNKANRTPTRRANAAFSQIATLNHQEVKDTVIANILCDCRYCPPVRLAAIEARAIELLAR
jgi:hypothetical protein